MAASESSILAVQKMYVAYYGRPGDPAGVNYWATVLDVEEATGGSLADIINQFGTSQEFLDGIGGSDNTTTDQVTILYQQMFNRDPEPEGLAFWVDAIDTGVYTLAQSALAIANGAQGSDITILTNKISAAVYYTDQVEATGASYQAEDIATAQGIIASVDETAKSVVDASLLTDQAMIDQGGSASVFTLTTGQDDIVGTSGNDIITGIFEDDSSDTFTLGDSIAAGDGSDTLELFVDDNSNALSFAGKTIDSVETAMIRSTHGDWNGFSVASNAFDDLIVDFSSSDTPDTTVTIESIHASTAVTIQGIGDDANTNLNINFSNDSNVNAVTTVTLQDMDHNEIYTDIEATQTAATSSTFNLNVMNVDSNDNFNVNANIDANTVADVNLAVNVDIDNVVGEDINFYLDFNTNGVTATAMIDIADSNVNDFELEIDNNNNGTSDMDVVTLNLDGLNNGVSDVNANADFDLDHFETININVTKDAVFGTINTYDLEGNDQAVNIDVAAGATMTIDGDFNMNDNNVGNQTVTITGAGNVDLGDLDMNSNVNTTATVDASTLTGDLTVYDSNGNGNIAGIDAITSGSGNDTIILDGYTTLLDSGAGDDFVDMNGVDYGHADAETLDGGADRDTIAIDDGNLLDSATAANISNFEILEIHDGNGNYNMKVESSLDGVSITDTDLNGNVNIQNAAAGTTLDFSVTGATDVNLMGGFDLTFNLDDDSGSSDELDITLSANDTDTDQTAEAEITASVIANGIEGVNIDSSATTKSKESAPGADDALTSADYTNTFTLFAEDVTDIVITGDAMLDLTIGDANANAHVVNFIDASANTAGVTVDASVTDIGGTNIITTGVTFSGSDAADTYNATQNGDTIQANGGADAINLDANTNFVSDDTVRYVSVDDSQLTLKDGDDDGDADTSSGYDVITDFGTAGTDIIELSSSLGLAGGDARSDILQKGTLAAGEDIADELEDLIGDGVDFFDTGLVDRATAFAEDSNGDGWLFIDADGDGDFAFADDMVINLAGVNTLAITDISFG